jgi:isoleucyl-tRNA synthetase
MILGNTMKGWEYVPLYDYFIDRKYDGCFKILLAGYVSKDAGTGIVH